jgi:uncharacterized lipoprotein YmbA
LVGLFLFATGCGMLSPKPDTSRYFMLRPTPAPPSAGAPLGDLVLGLGPVTVPEYLDQLEMLDLVGPYELKYSAQNRWVEALGGQIYRTLADNLHRQLSPDAILAYPWYASDGVGLQVEVSFDPIRLDESGAWQGGAAWVIRDPVTRATLERNASDFVLGTDSIPPQDMARRLSEELGRLAAEITLGVRRQYVR